MIAATCDHFHAQALPTPPVAEATCNHFHAQSVPTPFVAERIDTVPSDEPLKIDTVQSESLESAQLPASCASRDEGEQRDVAFIVPSGDMPLSVPECKDIE